MTSDEFYITELYQLTSKYSYYLGYKHALEVHEIIEEIAEVEADMKKIQIEIDSIVLKQKLNNK